MIAGKIEVEADSDFLMESETESSCENQGGRNRGRRAAGKKMKKVRSIKLPRMASTRKGRSCSIQSGYAASSEQSTPIEMSDASPNHISSCECDAKEDNFQVLPVTLTRQSSFKLLRSLSRKSSIKFRRSQLSKSSGGTDLKKKPKKSSRKEGNSIDDDHHSIIQSPHSSERPTCSSTLKDSKFPDHVEIKPAALNVCRYSYCSLHGHHQGNKPPPLKRFISMRRRVAKTQKTFKQERQSSAKETRSGNRKKGIKTEKRDFPEELGGVAQFDKTISTCNEKVAVKEEAQRDASGNIASSSNVQKYKDRSENSINNLEIISLGVVSELPNDIFSSASVTGTMGDSEENDEDDYQLNNGSLQAADSMAAISIDAENQKSFTFWKFIYQHMATSLDDELKNQKPLPAVDSEEVTGADQATSIEDDEASIQKLELTQSDAIKLVQKAFEKILSEIPDHSIATEVASDQDFLLKKQIDGKEADISTSSSSVEDSMVQDQEEMQIQTKNKSEQVKAAQMEGKTPNKQMPNGWSNLKKIIILKRFVKSLEKVRNLKPRTTRYLPMDKDTEAEKIRLRRQNMNGRKNAEEWMLDHALHNVISTLASSQKRKVALLVQAFETVIPLTENGDDMRSSASVSSPTTSVLANNESLVHNKGSQLDHEILHPQDSVPASSTDVACKTKMENQKNFTFWKFIYQRMAKDPDAELEAQKPVPGVDSEEQVEDLHKAHEKVSSQEISRTEQAMSKENDEASNRKLQFTQSDAIKLVQQAFDKILSEIPDHSSYEQPIAGEITSDQDIMLKKKVEGKEVKISTSSNTHKDCKEQDQEDMQLQTDNKPEEVKSEEMKGEKRDKQMPNRWSNLKKIIILKRFVKSLENLRPRTIQHLPMEKDPEAEKIQLRNQNMNGRKNSEWMLDHALRHVISTLAPSQQRKVALLVQAFETVIPLRENGDDMRSNAAASSPATSVLAYNGSSVHNSKSAKEETGSKGDQDKVRESHSANQHIPESSPEPKEKSLLYGYTEQPLFRASSELEEPRLSDDSLTDEGAARISHENVFAINEEVTQRTSKEETPIRSSEFCNMDSEFNIKKTYLGSGDLIASADVDPIEPECPTEVGDGTQQKKKLLHSSLGQSESKFVVDISMLEKQKYMRLWYLIYKNMVSGDAADNGSQLLQNVADKRDDDADSEGSAAAAGQDLKENYRTGNQNIGFHNNQIVKLVEEAIDEIPLPETPDETSDNQSVTGNVISDQELPEKKHGEEDVRFISSSSDSAKENTKEAISKRAELRSTLNSEENMLKPENVSTENEVKRETDGWNKSKRVQRNWSNLKKLILLRRFVKALEKVKEFYPRGPRYLPLNPAPEPEKVFLKQQNTEDRKNAENWMLDYALQQVVAKLTPERKKRVVLLVEAFETVIPTIS